MTLEYAPKGLMGVFTPQANTTVEPEMAILTPPGMAWINGRLMSDKGTIDARLHDYFDNYDKALAQFANAPVGAIGFACTGASYLAGATREDSTLAALTEQAGVPVITAATAVVDALGVLGARRIALVTPYHQSLNDASAVYWAERGFEVVAKPSAFRESTAFHPIYSLPSEAVPPVLDEVAETGADAVVILGTGLPSLRPIRDRPLVGDAPLLSCMLCIAWRMAGIARGMEPTREDLMSWVRAEHWGARLG
ncbi:MAG: aspartate/glutamate racemase family protein [Rhodobacteraceae bacterium]|nr:aspartate/glutamate racemase family protein [Paracoccaceae bacterium]